MMSIYTNKSDLFMSAAEDINNDTNKYLLAELI